MSIRTSTLFVRLIVSGFAIALLLTGGPALSQTVEETIPSVEDAQESTTTLEKEEAAPSMGPVPGDTEPPRGEGSEASTTEGIVRAASSETAVLYVFNQPIVEIQAVIWGLTPGERVADANQRLDAIIDSGASLTVSSQTTPLGMLIKVGGGGILLIVPEDLDPVSGETLEEKAKSVSEKLSAALQAYLSQKRPEVILKGIGQSAAALLIFLLCAWLIRKVYTLLCRRLGKLAAPRLDKIALGGFRPFETTKLIALGNRVINLWAWSTGIFLFYICVAYSLRQFPYTRPWGVASRDFILGVIKALAQGILQAIPNLFTVILIILITRFFIRLTRLFFSAVEAGRVNLPWLYSDTARPTGRIFVAILWLFALVFIYPYLPGSGSAAFKGLSVFAGVILSLGSTPITNQLMSGFVLMYSRALLVGDYVRIDETEGVVTARGILSTKIRNFKGEEVSLPNLVVLGTKIKNYSRLAETKGSLLYTTVSLGYSVPWRQVEGLLKEAAERTEGLRTNPPPFVSQVELSDFYVKYQLNAYLVRTEERRPVLTSLHANIQDIFNEHGVQIMSPHYIADPPEKVWVPKEKWHGAPAEPEADSRQGDPGDKGNG